jgi:hypothetical protein
MRGCQEQTREGDVGGSPGHGWTGRPKTDNILLVRWGVTKNVSKSFSYKDSLLNLATTRKEDFKINSTFKSHFLYYLGLLKGGKSDSSINCKWASYKTT